jgi:beta-N-acetylhexosaminidase
MVVRKGTQMARDLSLRLGQIFMIGIPGPHLDEETEALLRDFNIGGIILFARNIQEPVQVARLCRDLQKKAMEVHGTPLFLAVDQEGGRVARLREPFRVFPGNAAIGAADASVERAREFGLVTAREMKLVGLNMNLAPVVDVRRGEIEKHLEGRSFGEDPAKVALLGKTVVKALQESGVMAVAKHFPGLGRASLDPHHHLPRIDADKKEIQEINLPPFRAAVDAEVCGIMTSHALYPALDPEWPATLSPSVLTGLLRDEMHFGGLVMTDDLEMGAIAGRWSVAEGSAMALQAGADILLICEHQRNVREAFELILEIGRASCR